MNKIINHLKSHSQPIIIQSNNLDVDELMLSLPKRLNVSKSDVMVFSSLDEIEQLRRAIKQVNLRPHSSTMRLFFIIGADKVTTEQANTMLKILEEPPNYCKIILFARNPMRVIQTVRSRCQNYSFSKPDSNKKSARGLYEISENYRFDEFAKLVKEYDRQEALSLLEATLEEIKEKGLNDDSRKIYQEIADIYMRAESTTVNLVLVLEYLYLLINKK